jgi:type III pantothenate kinase
MLLAVDIGNSNIKFGIFDGEQLLSKFSIPTDRNATADGLKTTVGPRLDLPITSSIVCSVVPQIENALAEFLLSSIGVEPVFVRNDFDFGLKINYEPLTAAGTDRLVNAFSAVEKYGVPCIICSFGTATTFDVVDRDRVLMGGVIAPGMKTMAKALHLNTAQLPEVEVKTPESVIGNTTITSIRSGVFYGQIAIVEGIIDRIKKEMGDTPKVIATGGFASSIAENTDRFDLVDENLLLDGLHLLSRRGLSTQTLAPPA